jgi:hypothetical protein
MTITVTLQINMLIYFVQATHSKLTVPAEFLWTIVWVASGARDPGAVLKIDPLTRCSLAKQKR